MNVTMKKAIVQILLLAAIKFQIASSSRRHRHHEAHTTFSPFLRTNGDDSYEINRTKLIEQELKDFVGGNTELNEKERKVNKILMKLKKEDIKIWISTPETENLNEHYSKYMELIQSSELFQLIKKMPKGAALHVHSKFVLDANYTAALMDDKNLYVCFLHEPESTYSDIKLQFSSTPPDKKTCNNQHHNDWYEMHKLIYDSHERTVGQLRKLFTLIPKEEEANVKTEGKYHVDKNALWQKFEKIRSLIKVLINYRPIRQRFIYDTLKKLYDDNIMYAELRVNVRSLYQLHELDGTKHEPLYLIKLYDETTKQFIEEYPEFIGIKLIVSINIVTTKEEIKKAMSLAKNIKTDFPNIFAGFDLIGQGAKVRRLNKLKDILEENNDLKFFYHAGETNWFETVSDRNLIDAILLGSKRIGHENELVSHANFMDIIKEKDIAVEVNALSNVALNIDGIRDHPLGLYLAQKLPVVLSSDDPGIWGAEPLSHDFYVTFVALAHESFDLKFLKQLAINSIKYSALENTGRNKLYTNFKKRWGHFIKEVIEQYENDEEYLDCNSDCEGCLE